MTEPTARRGGALPLLDDVRESTTDRPAAGPHPVTSSGPRGSAVTCSCSSPVSRVGGPGLAAAPGRPRRRRPRFRPRGSALTGTGATGRSRGPAGLRAAQVLSREPPQPRCIQKQTATRVLSPRARRPGGRSPPGWRSRTRSSSPEARSRRNAPRLEQLPGGRRPPWCPRW